MSKNSFVKPGKNCGGASMSFLQLPVWPNNLHKKLQYFLVTSNGVRNKRFCPSGTEWCVIFFGHTYFQNKWSVQLGHTGLFQIWKVLTERVRLFLPKKFLVIACSENCWNAVSVLADLNDNWLLPIFNGLFLISFSILMSFSKGKKQKLYHQSCDKLKNIINNFYFNVHTKNS